MSKLPFIYSVEACLACYQMMCEQIIFFPSLVAIADWESNNKYHLHFRIMLSLKLPGFVFKMASLSKIAFSLAVTDIPNLSSFFVLSCEKGIGILTNLHIEVVCFGGMWKNIFLRWAAK